MDIVLHAVGDFILHGAKTEKDPFEFVHDQLDDCDILFGNNETVISDYDKPFFQKAFSIRSPKESQKYLARAGFDLLNFANNHCFDFGISGVEDTLKSFEALGIPSIGVGLTPEAAAAPVIIEREGIKIGFYGTSMGVHEIEQDGRKAYLKSVFDPAIFGDIKKLRAQVDVLVFSAHWGDESIELPSPKTQQLAHDIIDAGADLILGHHPHIPLGIEKYGRGVIVYSLGNFQFKMGYRPEFDYSFIFKAKLSRHGVDGYSVVPLMIGADSRPYPVVGEKADEVLGFIEKVSRPLEAGVTQDMFDDVACEIIFKNNLNAWAKRVETFGETHLLMMFKFFSDPHMCHLFYLLMKKKNWSLYDLTKSLGIYYKHPESFSK